MDFGIASVAAITVMAYLIGMLVKASGINDKWIPAICGLVGAVLGVVAMYIMPDFPANDIITALAVGVVSGLAATGANQIGKQLTAKIEADAAAGKEIGVSDATSSNVVKAIAVATQRESETKEDNENA